MSSSEYKINQEDEEASIPELAAPEDPALVPEPSPPLLQNLTLSSRPGSPAEPNPQKRKGKDGTQGPKARKNVLRSIRSLPIDRYLGIYNDTVKETLEPSEFEEAYARSSQHGIVTWSATEKNSFFSALSKKGKDGIPEIATLVGTKSEMEVQDYIKLLQESLEVHHLTNRSLSTIHLSDIPAAFEIGAKHCQTLEKLAYAALLRDEQAHNVEGKRKHRDMWLIDGEVASSVDSTMQADEQGGTETNHGIFATAGLFHLSNWIGLSEAVFMNFGHQKIEDNWANICFEDETPALTCEAFSDFYALAISLTRRLVQSSIFFALSRIRALQRGGWPPKSLVRVADVRSALEVLKMKPNAQDYWIDVPRRCALHVRARIKPPHRKVGVLSFDEVETRLSGGGAASHAIPTSEQETQALDFSETSSQEDNASEVNATQGTATNDPTAVSSDEELSDPDEIYASKLDRLASREEESQILRRLDPPSLSSSANGYPVPESDIKAESDNETILQRPAGKRKTKEELTDWRSRTLYRSEWETKAKMEDEEPDHRRKRRRVDGGGS